MNGVADAGDLTELRRELDLLAAEPTEPKIQLQESLDRSADPLPQQSVLDVIDLNKCSDWLYRSYTVAPEPRPIHYLICIASSSTSANVLTQAERFKDAPFESTLQAGWRHDDSDANQLVYAWSQGDASAHLWTEGPDPLRAANDLQQHLSASLESSPVPFHPFASQGLGAAGTGLLAVPYIAIFRLAQRTGRWLRRRPRKIVGVNFDVDSREDARRMRASSALFSWCSTISLLYAVPIIVAASILLLDFGAPQLTLIFVPINLAIIVQISVDLWRRYDGGRATIRGRLSFSSLALLTAEFALIGAALLFLVTSFTLNQGALDASEIVRDERDLAFVSYQTLFAVLVWILVATLGALISRRSLIVRNAPIPDSLVVDVLYLRSFSDDKLRIGITPSPRVGVLDEWSMRLTDRFEEVIAWHLQAEGVMLSTSGPGRSRRGIGSLRVYKSEKEWHQWVATTARRARVIVVVLGDDTPSHKGSCSQQESSYRWELKQIAGDELWYKTIFVVPPADRESIARRGAILREFTRPLGPTSANDYQLQDALAVVVDHSGKPRRIGGDKRDEPAYRAALDAAIRLLPRDADEGPEVSPSYVSWRLYDHLGHPAAT